MTQLLSDLKALVEMGVVFEVRHITDWNLKEDFVQGDNPYYFGLKGSKLRYTIPTVEWVEGKIVEEYPKVCDDPVFIQSRYLFVFKEWEYILDAVMSTRHPIRLNASVSLLRKLMEVKEK